jgi:hypothetical protein
MENYIIKQPVIDGILSDDYLYFEGIDRPSEIFMIRDESVDENNRDVLEKYFNDIYNLFLRKMSIFTSSNHSTDEEMIKIQALLQELIKVKKILQDLL